MGEAAFIISNRPMGAPRVGGTRGVGLGRLRKIALCGNASTLAEAPLHDETWEIWAHASSRMHLRDSRVDRFFDLHPRSFWGPGKKWDPEYVEWLTRQPVPIYMQRRHADVPASVKYPKDRVMAEFGRYFTSQAAWMIALALTEGVTHLGLYGIHYATDSEYVTQRAGCEYWLGVAFGRGVQIVIPHGNPILKTPHLLYGYESHNDGALHACYRPDLKEQRRTPSGLHGTIIDMADPANRPPLRDIGEPIAWAHSGHTHHA